MALYFSAHWCPPCREFTPQLKTVYDEAKAAGKPFEVVFVSSDESPEGQAKYMTEAHGDWLAVRHDDPLREKLKEQYSTFAGREVEKFAAVSRKEGIPTLIIVGPDGAELQMEKNSACETGNSAITTQGVSIIDSWLQFAWPQ